MVSQDQLSWYLPKSVQNLNFQRSPGNRLASMIAEQNPMLALHDGYDRCDLDAKASSTSLSIHLFMFVPGNAEENSSDFLLPFIYN